MIVYLASDTIVYLASATICIAFGNSDDVSHKRLLAWVYPYVISIWLESSLAKSSGSVYGSDSELSNVVFSVHK